MQHSNIAGHGVKNGLTIQQIRDNPVAAAAFTEQMQVLLKSIEHCLSYHAKVVDDISLLQEFPGFEGKDSIIQQVNIRNTLAGLQHQKYTIYQILDAIHCP